MRSFLVFLVFLGLIAVSGWAIYRVNTRETAVAPQINLSMTTPTPVVNTDSTPAPATPVAVVPTTQASTPVLVTPDTNGKLPQAGSPLAGLALGFTVLGVAGGAVLSQVRAKQAVKKAYTAR